MDQKMTRFSYLMDQHQDYREWYDRAEDKAKFVITLDTILAAALSAVGFTSGWGLVFSGLHGVALALVLAAASAT